MKLVGFEFFVETKGDKEKEMWSINNCQKSDKDQLEVSSIEKERYGRSKDLQAILRPD